MISGISIVTRAAAAIVMIAALCFLTTANFWVYGIKKDKPSAAAVADSCGDEDQDSSNAPPNPVEEKNANSLQNLSEYLHDHHHSFDHPVSMKLFGNRHDIITLPIHHPELLTPPPKSA